MRLRNLLHRVFYVRDIVVFFQRPQLQKTEKTVYTSGFLRFYDIHLKHVILVVD